MYPRIVCHIMGSVDGRLLTDRWTEPFDGKSKGELMGIYAAIGRRLNTDAWMFGKNTLCEGCFPQKFPAADPTPSAGPEPFVARRSSDRLFVVADPEADILFERSTVRGDSIVTILPETAPAAYLQHLRDQGVSYLFAGHDGKDLRSAMQTLAEAFGVERLSLQGGGIIDGAFLEAGLIDELSLVVYPGIDGSADSTSIFHYVGRGNPAQGQRLELLSAETMATEWFGYGINFIDERGRCLAHGVNCFDAVLP